MDRKHAAIRGSGAIVSDQYLGILGRNENLAPVKALLFAILEDAIHRVRHYGAARHQLGKQCFREAESWINRHGRDWGFTFDNVCELLGIEPEYLRRKIFEEEISEKKVGPQSVCLNGSGERRYSPKRVRDGGSLNGTIGGDE